MSTPSGRHASRRSRRSSAAKSDDAPPPGPPWHIDWRLTTSLCSFGFVCHDPPVVVRRQDLDAGASVDRVNRSSRFQKGSVAVFELVVRIANVPGDLELHVSDHRPEVTLLERRGDIQAGYVLGAADLDEVDPVDLDVAAAGC